MTSFDLPPIRLILSLTLEDQPLGPHPLHLGTNVSIRVPCLSIAYRRCLVPQFQRLRLVGTSLSQSDAVNVSTRNYPKSQKSVHKLYRIIK